MENSVMNAVTIFSTPFRDRDSPLNSEKNRNGAGDVVTSEGTTAPTRHTHTGGRLQRGLLTTAGHGHGYAHRP
jgi:hypothetical protein